MEDEIIVIDKIEEAEDNKGKTYLKITDKAGVTRNFKEGRSNLLTNKGHLLEEGKAIKLHFADYKAPGGQVFPFVKDFESVEDAFVAQATTKVQAQTKDSREDSIESQVGQKGGIEVLKVLIEQALLTNEEIQKCKEYAMSSVDWGMGRINLPSVIVDKIKEAKSENKDTAETSNQQPGEERAPGQASEEALGLESEEPKTVGEFLTWLKDHDIKAPRAWLEVEYKVSHGEVLTIEKCQELYAKIKKDKKFNN